MLRVLALAAGCAALFCASPAHALKTISYESPLNRERAVRPRTDYIILHTTEAPTKSSLNEIKRYGEAHFVVDPAGRVYKVIDRKRIATHAGRSMWDGRRTIDNYSIGIEVVGKHDGRITDSQVDALRELLSQLQSAYGIPDRNVLCHAMVAYGSPNKWHKRSHRGRKRCGMLFASATLRARLGLSDKPTRDPDVDAGRLVVGDQELQRVLYGNRGATADAEPSPQQQQRRNSPPPAVETPDTEPQAAFEGFREIGRDGKSAVAIAGGEHMEKTTIYFLTNGMIRRGDQIPRSEIDKLPPGTRMLLGYTYGGYISAKRAARDICGDRWNYPSTCYRLPDGKIKTGDTMKDRTIPSGTLVFFLQ